MAVGTGSRLGQYEILVALGAGGMGEVDRAKDTKLGRDVALKILPASFTNDPERVARFRREAQVLASLNHPHIAQIHGLEEVNGTQFLVLELVDGESLDKRIARGPIPVDEALTIAKQIAEALEAAHEKGIIHRDLKPANIALTKDGQVKVLDFGLAKAVEATSGPLDAMNSPTITSPAMMTGVGVILGTAAYMSPEQATGQAVDKQSDVWAFGCVLYELFAGEMAFREATSSATVAAILQREPDWTKLRADTPLAVRRLLGRCLQKGRRQRQRDLGDARLDLERVALNESVPPARTRPTAFVAVGLTALLLVAFAFVQVLVRPASRSISSRVTRLTIVLPGAASLILNSGDRSMAISPDALHIAYVGRPSGRLYIRSLNALEPRRIDDIRGGVRGPVFSPDSQWVAFIANDQLQKVAVAGGPPVALCQLDGTPRGASWRRDGSIVFATANPDTGLWEVSNGGGEPRLVTRPDHTKHELDHLWPDVLPDGRAVLFTIRSSTGTDSIAVRDLQTGAQRVVVPAGSNAHYVPSSGQLVYSAGDTLRAIAFDPARLETRGEATPVLSRVQTFPNGHAYFDLARDGTLVYVSAGAQSAERTLVWVDRAGREEPIAFPPRAYGHLRISPDGTRVAIGIDEQERQIWMWDIRKATLQPFTIGRSRNAAPVWTPNGRDLLFASNRAGPPNIFRQAADGTGPVERITESANPQTPTSISPDGAHLVFTEVGATPDVMMVRVSQRGQSGDESHRDNGARRPEPLVQTPDNDQAGEISPNGRWLAYVSFASGRAEIYVRPFPNVQDGQWRVSVDGGKGPLWAPDGTELFYANVEGALMSVPVEGERTWSAGRPQKVLDAHYFVGPEESDRTYDIAPDGRRFLMSKPAEGSATTDRDLIVVQNWADELKGRVPPK
jgi:serine/threonine-protein kinase